MFIRKDKEMEFPTLRLWILFYLIAFATVLWAAFMSSQGTMLWVSLMLVIIIIGISSSTVYAEIKKQMKRQELQRELTQNMKDSKGHGGR